MDLPLQLEQMSFVDSLEELKQTIYIMLKTNIGEFIQNPTMGSWIDIHSTDEDLVKESIRTTLEQIPGLTTLQVAQTEDYYRVVVRYRGDVEEFSFDKNTIHNE